MIKLTEEEKDAWRIVTGLLDEWSDDDSDPELNDYACRAWGLMSQIFSKKLDKEYHRGC